MRGPVCELFSPEGDCGDGEASRFRLREFDGGESDKIIISSSL